MCHNTTNVKLPTTTQANPNRLKLVAQSALGEMSDQCNSSFLFWKSSWQRVGSRVAEEQLFGCKVATTSKAQNWTGGCRVENLNVINQRQRLRKCAPVVARLHPATVVKYERNTIAVAPDSDFNRRMTATHLLVGTCLPNMLSCSIGLLAATTFEIFSEPMPQRYKSSQRQKNSAGHTKE